MTTVSPKAREAPSTTAATTPDSAAGRMTRRETCMRLAPMPKAPSRSDCGTADMLSSATDAMVGRTSRPTMMPAASWLLVPTPEPRIGLRISGVKKARAK
jgi:hypothetical protein